MVNAMEGSAVGEYGTILRTNTGGMYGWSRQVGGTEKNLRAVSFANVNLGIAVGDSVIIRTEDGGVHWIPSSFETTSRVTDVSFPMENLAVAVGLGGLVLRTTDAGITWTQQTGVTAITHVRFVDDLTGYGVGSAGTILKTTDGGRTWLSQSSGTTASFSAVDFYDTDRGIVGGGGVIRWTTNGGQDWNPQTSGPALQGISGIAMLGPTTAIAVGYYIYSSTDGGATWPDMDSVAAPLRAVSFSDPNTGTAVGSGVILRTLDGGLSWTRQSPGLGSALFGVALATSSEGIAVGAGGIVYRTTTGGVFAGVGTVGRRIPEVNVLEQNYPNPFNPATTIRFTLEHPGFARLRIYNLLGQEVTTLIASELSAGPHTVRWEVRDVPSGVYFFRLEVGHFVETKKLILLR